jgi:hypothetical protein
MSKSKATSVSREDLTDEDLREYYKESAMDGLLYWMNCTTQVAGANTALTILTEMLATAIEQLVPPDQVTRAEDVIFGALDDAFTVVKSSAKVSEKSSDKGNMN